MLIVGLDTETTGLSPKDDFITEIGAVAWDVPRATPVAFFHRFIKQEKPLPDFIKELTGLTDDVLEKYGVSEKEALLDFRAFASQGEYLVAQNAPFDRGMIDAAKLRNGIFLLDKVWIDTAKDVPYPARMKNRNLVGLAAEHGFLNPFPHRAVTDVLTMLTIMSKYDFNNIVDNACAVKILLWAKTTYAEKEKAKACGFYYNGDRKMWFKTIFERDLKEEVEKCRIQGFEVEVINDTSKEEK